jgi:DNA-binding NtrC family response regulator
MPDALPWPGNTRELENEVKRLVASVRGKSIDENHLDVLIRSLRRDNVEAAEEIISNRSLPAALEQLERRMIASAAAINKKRLRCWAQAARG